MLGVILLSSVTCAFEHVAGCHAVFLFLEILRKESMFFALVKNGRHLKTRATTCTKAPCKKNVIFCWWIRVKVVPLHLLHCAAENKMEVSRHSTPCTRSSTKIDKLNIFSPVQKHVVRGILGYVCAKNQSVLVIFGVVWYDHIVKIKSPSMGSSPYK